MFLSLMGHRRRSRSAGPVLAGPLFLAVPAGPVFGRTTGPLEQHSNPTHGLHVLLAGLLFEAVWGVRYPHLCDFSHFQKCDNYVITPSNV